MFKSPDQKRQEAAANSATGPCDTCHGTGTVGIGGSGAITSSTCGACGGSGQKKTR